MTSVTAVIPHYGDPATALALVRSLQTQRGGLLAGIVVSDDASPVPFPETEGVHVVRRERNGGFGSAVNTGMERVETELALVLNSDLEIGATFVEDLVRAAYPWQPAVVSPHVVRPNGVQEWIGAHFPSPAHHATEWLSPLARFRESDAWREGVGIDSRCTEGVVVPVDWVKGAAMLIPVGPFRAVGGFDEAYFMFAEEVDLQRRLREVGVPSIFAGTVTVTHEGGGSSDPERRRHWLVESRLKYAAKWGGESALKASLATASVVNFGVNALRQVAGRDVDSVATLRRELGYLKPGQERGQ
ncbi:glycosyltransferase family 2 protein [Sinomonas sp. ASV486]|uniref:glycosyltransferase family 2 protein n=1 Tax=Sinomonas sp. ASV486 TaxID=3051170 RepID=UPI0027DCC31D|nr:glycosyltransferase family 2 protein [Sinomonas sp. ASV486]MDQ4488836.1 glycosyltransferase family 2 protein [Sinomonas sp. ASV486]